MGLPACGCLGGVEECCCRELLASSGAVCELLLGGPLPTCSSSCRCTPAAPDAANEPCISIAPRSCRSLSSHHLATALQVRGIQSVVHNQTLPDLITPE